MQHIERADFEAVDFFDTDENIQKIIRNTITNFDSFVSIV